MKYARILTRLYNTPLLMDSSKLDIITSNVTMKLLAGDIVTNGVAEPTDKEELSSSIPIINVFDSLVAKGGAGASGFTSYEGIRKQTMSAIESGAYKIGFYIDSPGGEASGLFALTDFLASIPETYGVETFGFTDGLAASAAYGIASSLQKVYATPSSMSGSIGAIMALVDQTKLDAKEGVTYHIIRSEEEKGLGNPHEVVTTEILQKFQSKVDSLGEIFHTEVVKNRPSLSIEVLKSLKGNVLMGEKALEIGLVDYLVSSIDEVIALETNPVTKSTNKLTTTIGKSMTLEELKTKLEESEQVNLALNAEVATLKAAATQIGVTATLEERTRCTELLASAETLKISAEQVNKRISAGTSAEDSLDIFTAIAEATGNATAVDTPTSVQTTINDNTTISADTSTKIDIGGLTASTSEIMAAVELLKGAK